MASTIASLSPTSAIRWSPGLPSARYGVAVVIASAAVAAVGLGLDDASRESRVALITFILAIIGWCVLQLPATPVALAAGLGLVLTGVVPDDALYASLGHELVWLLVAAFIIASALRRTGLAARYVLAAISLAASVSRLFYASSLVITATAFVVPSTSGRAALLLPVYLALAAVIDDARIRRALALLFPTAILLSACASLMGAGAHLIAADFMMRFGGTPVSFLGWTLLGAPFAIASVLLATALILHLFLCPDERRQRPALPAPDEAPLTPAQIYTLVVTTITIAFWASQPWHGLSLAVVALAGALAVTCGPLSGVSMKDAIKETEWNLLLFLAATLMLGEALIDTGSAALLADKALTALAGPTLPTPLTVVLIATLSSLLAHLVVTSRTARVMVLIPSIAIPLSAFGVDPAALIFLVTIGSGFCQTLSVSAKPVALYRTLDQPTYDEHDLLRLSLWFLPFMAALLTLFSLWIWPLLGLTLTP